MNNSNDTSWDRTSDLPICSTEPTAVPLLQVSRLRNLFPGFIFNSSCHLVIFSVLCLTLVTVLSAFGAILYVIQNQAGYCFVTQWRE